MDATVHARYREFRKSGVPALRAWEDAHRYSDGSAYCWALEREAARIAAWNAAHPVVRIGRTPDCVRSLAEIRKWKVDRSSGFLKVVKTAARKPAPARQLAALRLLVMAHGTPELVRLMQDRDLAA